MIVKDYNFNTNTVTICEPNRFERIYDGAVEKIPQFLKDYTVVHITINVYIDNTYMEVEKC